MKIERWVHRYGAIECGVYILKENTYPFHYYIKKEFKAIFGFTPRKGRWTKFYITKGK